MPSRREFLKFLVAGGAALALPINLVSPRRVVAAPAAATAQALAAAGILDGTIDPTTILKYQDPLVIPPAMPRSGKISAQGGKNTDYYEIAVRQFQQNILPASMGKPTTVWSYGAVQAPGTVAEGGSFHYPAFTIEAKYRRPLRVKWINDLVDANGNYLPHLLPVDQTLHWANPPGGEMGRDMRGTDQAPYDGPVPIITHVHGAHTEQEFDGYPEAWYLPDATIPDGYAPTGTYYDIFKASSPLGAQWGPGFTTFEYPNDQRATTLWYHDHTLGMTRLNVYAGPAGFYVLRGGPDDTVLDAKGKPAVLPGPAPALGDLPGMTYYEIPIAIQDRIFKSDGSLFFPDNRAFFEGLLESQLQIPFIPDEACDLGESDISPIWNPEFFGNTMVVNGKTWPYLEVEQRRYRFRLLNGCNSRFLILKMSYPGLNFWQIGAEGGYLPQPVELPELLIGLAERADVIVDFGNVPAGTLITLLNLGPDEPFGGPPFDPADPATTGQVMQFRVVARSGPDKTTPPQQLVLPAIAPLPAPSGTRRLSLNEEDSATVKVEEVNGNIVLDCADGEPFGPAAALLGRLHPDGTAEPLLWMDGVTENPAVGATEDWEFYNFTMDAHPMHVHLVQFQVINRQSLETDADGMAMQPAVLVGNPRQPEAWETGFKDTVIAYPGEVTRIRATFDKAGLFVWHCHIIDHEDNEMMRPYRVGP